MLMSQVVQFAANPGVSKRIPRLAPREVQTELWSSDEPRSERGLPIQHLCLFVNEQDGPPGPFSRPRVP